jgi:hypothetical protein
MANSIEWGHAAIGPVLLDNEAVREAVRDFDEQDVAGDWALTLGSDGAILLYGTPSELRDWCVRALKALEEPVRKEHNAQVKAKRKAAGAKKCPHDWVLTEDGYTRTWGTRIEKREEVIDGHLEDVTYIIASFDGTSDWTEEGEGEYLLCSNCGAIKNVPAKWEIEWT